MESPVGQILPYPYYRLKDLELVRLMVLSSGQLFPSWDTWQDLEILRVDVAARWVGVAGVCYWHLVCQECY